MGTINTEPSREADNRGFFGQEIPRHLRYTQTGQMNQHLVQDKVDSEARRTSLCSQLAHTDELER